MGILLDRKFGSQVGSRLNSMLKTSLTGGELKRELYIYEAQWYIIRSRKKGRRWDEVYSKTSRSDALYMYPVHTST